MKCLVGFKFLLLSANCSRKVLNDANCVCCCHVKYMTQSKKLKWKKGRTDKVWDAFFSYILKPIFRDDLLYHLTRLLLLIKL